MAVNIAGVIVIGVLILVLGILAGTSIMATTRVGESAFQSNDLKGEQARTKLEFVSAQGGATGLTLKVKNTGLTSVFDYDSMDVIVEYPDAASNQISTRLSYTTGTLGNNEWEKTSITPDTYQSGAWNPNETISMDAILSPAQKADSTATVTVSTPNGVPVSWIFGPSGFFWFTDAPDISLITAGSWRDMDLSSVVPVGTTGVIVEIVNTDVTDTLSGLVRGKEDTRDYISNLNFQRVADETHRWQIVKVDSDRVIQGYVEDRQIDFKLLGYTMGTDPSYFNTPFDITPATESAWTIADVSAFVDADADGVILFIVSTQDGDRNYGVREIGSSFSTTNRDLENFSSTMYMVGLDASYQFEVYHTDFDDVKFYLVGQTKGSVVYYTNDLAVSDPATGSFQEIDADSYSVPAIANGLILRVVGTGTNLISALRHGDSTDDWTPDIGGGNHIHAAVGINDDNMWDEYIEGTSIDVSIAAYIRTISN
jgi:archaellum component FlaG (FlaF/FlaG flagellin family)